LMCLPSGHDGRAAPLLSGGRFESIEVIVIDRFYLDLSSHSAILPCQNVGCAIALCLW
jgi:hypothetical protein